MDPTTLQVIWFVLWGLLWTVYFMLDGFVLGSGFMSVFLAKSDTEKRQVINSVGPVWDGNEVWLVTAGGATFAAFPTTYAMMFSNLYLALFLLLSALIFRGVSFEFRGKVDKAGWKKFWDVVMVVSSFIPALLFGVAFGNIFEGLPMKNDFAAATFAYQGTFFGLLNPYALVTGLLFVLLFAVHGSLYTALKTDGEIAQRAKAMVKRLWWPLLAVAVAFLVYTAFATKLWDNYLASPILLILPLLAVAGLVSVFIFASRDSYGLAFAASLVTVATVVATGVGGLFPNLIPSSLDPASNLNIMNSSSSDYTLRVMTVVAFVIVPIVIIYKIWVYRLFRAPVTAAEVSEGKQPY
ncbi:MAG TPA: cytochrome d ubiquinol oxidase subunit II [Rectinemataceae bacterium]|nr:cytochrome d ubiquinol oxidase subunit II [Rectinemataceae bacterium]